MNTAPNRRASDNASSPPGTSPTRRFSDMLKESSDSAMAVYIPIDQLTSAKIEELLTAGKTPYTLYTRAGVVGGRIALYYSHKLSAATDHIFVGWEGVDKNRCRIHTVRVGVSNGTPIRAHFLYDMPTTEMVSDEYVSKTALDDAFMKVNLPMTYYPDTNTVTLDLTNRGGIAGFAQKYYDGVNFMFTLPMTVVSSALDGSLSFTPSGACSGSDPTKVFLSLMAVYDTVTYSVVLRPRDENVLGGELKRINGS